MASLRCPVLGLLLAAACAGPGAGQPRSRLDFEPGALALPLTVTERSGVRRAGAVVTSGVPFPPGFLKDPGRLAVLDRAGRPVPTQVSVMSRWWKPAYDGSVRWARVSFPATVEAGRYARYTLVDRPVTGRPEAERAFARVTVAAAGDAWVVDTGVARFTVPNKGGTLLRRAEVGGVNLLATDGVRVLLAGGEWPAAGMKQGGLHFGLGTRVDVEERGPVRAVLAVKGTFRGRDPGTFRGDLYDFTVRLYFLAGSTAVRVVHTIRNGRLGAELHVWPVEDLSLFAHLAVGDHAGALLLGEKDPVPVDFGEARVASLYQDSSGGPEWKELKSRRNYAAWLAGYTRTPRDAPRRTASYFVRGASFPGYELRADETVLERGARARGVVLVSGSRGGLLAAMRHFRVRCPAAITASRGALRIGLWPGEYADPLFLEPGQRFTRELLLDFRRGRIPGAALGSAHAVLDRRLLFTAPGGWYARTGAWDAGLAEVWRGFAAGRGLAGRGGWNKDALQGIDVGWDWFGWITGWNAGGAHWNQSTCFADWLLRQDGAAFDVAEARALWASDVTPLHFDPCDLGRYWQVLRGWKWRDCGITKKVFPGYYRRAVWGNPDDGHLGMFMWFEYHDLTGDRRVRESCLALGQRARAYLWSWSHDDVRTGGPGGRPVAWCRRRHPDDPTFRLHSRYTGWPLYTLALDYQLTGDPAVAREAAIVAAGLRNTARWSPIGFLTTQISKAGVHTAYIDQQAIGPAPTDSVSQLYANFQIGVCATGLVQYYRETRDEEALDTLVGIADFFVHHALIRDRMGRPHGWSYVFGDYWGPYRLEDFAGRYRPNWLNQNFRVLQPLGWIYRLTGRRDYLDVLRAGVAGARGGITARVPAALAAVRDPREDATPPAAVDDLEATAAGGGKVRLTWTAPGDDGDRGTAARYQVKRSRSPIVERVRGWPDRTPPLPRTAAAWEAKARAFHARQRAFWAALNCRGEPIPKKAGSREAFAVSGLEPGVWYFALKSWDDGPNLSALSNVVRVEVR